jgi:transcriptional regulator GlxA family with amidase domain
MKDIAFILYPGLTLLDLVGPLQVLNSMCERNNQFRTVVVAKDFDAVKVDVPLWLTPSATFQDIRSPSVVVVPGGAAGTIKAMGDEELLGYLKEVAESADFVCSVCTGSLLLAAAGLLDGREATTHWGCSRILELLGAKHVRKRWVQDGKFFTSAGVSAGIDMALQLVSILTDEATARSVQLGIEYDPEPPFGRIKWGEVDRNQLLPYLRMQIKTHLSDNPDLISRLSDL